jgi:hypothetical protein
MSSIHELSAIISQLELRVNNFKVANPTDKQKASIESQVRLIAQLQDIYDEYAKFSMWDMFTEIQKEVDVITDKDSEIEGVIIRIPFKEKSKSQKYRFINFTL